MNTDFTAFGKHYQLYRYPADAPRDLQAWDSADDYLLEQLTPDELVSDQPIMLFNDSFGALALALHGALPNGAGATVLSVGDSRLSRQGLAQNLKRNGFACDAVTHQDCLAALPDQPQLVMIKVPKTLALLEQQLILLRQVCTEQTRVIAAGKTKDIHTSTLKLFERYLGPTRTSLAKKKSRLIFCQVDPQILQTERANPYPKRWSLEKTDYQMVNHANVFSRDSLDIGARLMLAHLPRNLGDKQVADLGCGNGVLGLMLLHHNPQIQLTLVDESYMALASAQQTIAENLPQQLEQCHVVADNCLSSFSDQQFDTVVCNPPFHQQQVVTTHVAQQMFRDAKRCLKPGGELWVIANRHLGYHAQLNKLFGHCQLVANDHKFVVLRAER